MNREEWAAWAKSLKPGDNVIVKSNRLVLVDVVKRVTPSGWVVTLRNGTYSQSQWREWYSERGGYKEIVPCTAELAEEAKRQKEEAEKLCKINRAIRAAKSVAYDWAYGKRKVDLKLALKILELSGEEIDQ